MTADGKKYVSARERPARNMRTRRTNAGLSQEALAELCGLHRTYIGSVERRERNVSIHNVEKIASALQLDIVDLLTP